jgi:hypothetical protein
MLLNARRVDHLKVMILLVIADVTDARRAAEQQKVLLGELQRRVKNLLMNVRALWQLTAQGSSTLEGFTKAFDDRLDAMARTQDLLVRGVGLRVCCSLLFLPFSVESLWVETGVAGRKPDASFRFCDRFDQVLNGLKNRLDLLALFFLFRAQLL